MIKTHDIGKINYMVWCDESKPVETDLYVITCEVMKDGFVLHFKEKDLTQIQLVTVVSCCEEIDNMMESK